MDYSGFETNCALSLFLLGKNLHRIDGCQTQEQVQELFTQFVYLMQNRTNKECGWGEVHAFRSLGSLSLLSGFKQRAASYYRNAIDALTLLVGPDSPDIADTLRLLSMCESDINQISKLSDQARTIEEKSGQANPLETVIKSLESKEVNLPKELRAFAGIANEAKHDTLSIDSRFEGKQQHNAMPEPLSSEDYHKQLLSLLNKALALAKQHFADSWSDQWSTRADSYWGTTIGLLKTITDCHRKIGDLPAAVASWKEIVLILERTRGQNNIFLGKALLQLSQIYQELGQLEIAEQHKVRALAMGNHPKSSN